MAEIVRGWVILILVEASHRENRGKFEKHRNSSISKKYPLMKISKFRYFDRMIVIHRMNYDNTSEDRCFERERPLYRMILYIKWTFIGFSNKSFGLLFFHKNKFMFSMIFLLVVKYFYRLQGPILEEGTMEETFYVHIVQSFRSGIHYGVSLVTSNICRPVR